MDSRVAERNLGGKMDEERNSGTTKGEKKKELTDNSKGEEGEPTPHDSEHPDDIGNVHHHHHHHHHRKHAKTQTYVTASVMASVLSFVLLLSAELHASEHRIAIVVAGAALGIIAVLLTYCAGSFLHGKAAGWKFFQPLQGGIRFVTLQAVGWTTFALCIVLSVAPIILLTLYPAAAVKGLILAAGTAGLVSEVVMVCSLTQYMPKGLQGPRDATAPSSPVQQQTVVIPGWKEFLQSKQGHRWWGTFIGLPFLLALVGLTLSALADTFYEHHEPRFLLAVFALGCVCLASTLTYGIGGRWRYYEEQWNFIQPGLGGVWFVGLQALAWTLFSVAVLIFLLHIDRLFSASMQFPGPLQWLTYNRQDLPSLLSAAIMGLAADILNASSLLVYKDDRSGAGDAKKRAHREGKQGTSATPPLRSADGVPSSPPTISAAATTAKGEELISSPAAVFRHVPGTLSHALCCVQVWFMYNMEKVTLLVIFWSFYLAPEYPVAIVGSWLVGGVIYGNTFRGSPSVSGRRTKKGMRGHPLFNNLAAYFPLRLFRVKPLDPAHRYVMGFHPHAILPLTCGWMHFTQQWLDLFPGITPANLTSTIIHYVPIMRDVSQLLCTYEVSRTGFLNALWKERAVLLVPGGQKEMIESHSSNPNIVIKTMHKGFIRLALTTAVKSESSGDGDVYLVPVYSFGETRILDNLQVPKSIQEFFMKFLRANVMFFPYGSFGIPGQPRPLSLNVVVGEPIRVPAVAHFTEAQVDLLHRRYYTTLEQTFHAYKDNEHILHGGDRIVFDPPVEHIDEHEFETQWRALLAPTASDAAADRCSDSSHGTDERSERRSRHGKRSKHMSKEKFFIATVFALIYSALVYHAFGSEAIESLAQRLPGFSGGQ